MKTQNLLSAKTVASRWDCHRSTVLRICQRYGYSGVKFGSDPASTRRFDKAEIEQIEKAAGIIRPPSQEPRDQNPEVSPSSPGNETSGSSEK